MNEDWKERFDQVYEGFIERNNITARRETLKPHAAEAHPILITLAEDAVPGDEKKTTDERPTLEYGELAKQIGSNSSYIWKILVTIDKIGEKQGDPPVSSLVESANTEGPGHGYFKWNHLVEGDITIPKDKAGLTDEQKGVWRSNLRRVYKHEDWYWP